MFLVPYHLSKSLSYDYITSPADISSYETLFKFWQVSIYIFPLSVVHKTCSANFDEKWIINGFTIEVLQHSFGLAAWHL